MKIATLFISMISVLIGCSSMKKVIEPPKVKLQEIHISKLSALHTDLEIILSVKNPNNINFDVKNLKYSLRSSACSIQRYFKLSFFTTSKRWGSLLR
jgi:LEA14-like dessication related protein